MKKRTAIDWVVLGIVVVIAAIIIALSFGNTAKLAGILGINPYLTAGLVEVLFGSLLFIRGRQRATQRNVPGFLSAGYWISLAFVTAVNMWGLAQENVVIGSIVGLAISGAMWLMENTLVWLWTDSHNPYKQSIWERKQEAKRDIKEQKEIQRIEWMKWEARKPDLNLIETARKAEEKRKDTVGDGLPEFFIQQQQEAKQLETTQEVAASPIIVDVDTEEEKKAEIIPMRTIGFQMEQNPSVNRFKPNNQRREEAVKTAKTMAESLGRIPTHKELLDKGLTSHYSKYARSMLEG